MWFFSLVKESKFFSFPSCLKHGTKKKSWVLVRKKCFLVPHSPQDKKIFCYYKNSLQYQANKKWEYLRKASIRRLLVDPIPNSPTWYYKIWIRKIGIFELGKGKANFSLLHLVSSMGQRKNLKSFVPHSQKDKKNIFHHYKNCMADIN